ncbi:MAG TPA: four helix bundle protein [Terriglobales bacterium]|nr:four helix bundle protein [Terriglobales bacterium]
MGHSYSDLMVRQKAIDLVVEVYRHTSSFPKEEIYGLTSQIRRSAVSIPCNIAEGQGRLTRGEFKQFLGHARGLLLELQTQITISKNLAFLDEESASSLIKSAEVHRMLNGLLQSLK